MHRGKGDRFVRVSELPVCSNDNVSIEKLQWCLIDFGDLMKETWLFFYKTFWVALETILLCFTGPFNTLHHAWNGGVCYLTCLTPKSISTVYLDYREATMMSYRLWRPYERNMIILLYNILSGFRNFFYCVLLVLQHEQDLHHTWNGGVFLSLFPTHIRV